jgi:hypothetical protein
MINVGLEAIDTHIYKHFLKAKFLLLMKNTWNMECVLTFILHQQNQFAANSFLFSSTNCSTTSRTESLYPFNSPNTFTVSLASML